MRHLIVGFALSTGSLFGLGMAGQARAASVQIESALAPHASAGDINAGDRAGALVAASTGILYGTAEFGGAHGYGEVYSLTPPVRAGTFWQRTTIYSFTDQGDGAYPIGGVLPGAGGVLYGVTSGDELGLSRGPLGKNGVLYAVKLPVARGGAATETTLASLGYYSPSGGLVADAKGALYGAAQLGSSLSSTGRIFRFGPPARIAGHSAPGPTWALTTVHEFSTPTAGSFPQGTLTFGADGNLYGVAEMGGDLACHDGMGCGTVFSLTPQVSNAEWRLKVLAVFHGGTTGDRPMGPLALDAKGNIVGVTYFGGESSTICTQGCGVVFNLSATGGLSIVHRFCATRTEIYLACPNGLQPASGLALVNGIFYGSAALGGSIDRDGTVFAINGFGTFSTMATLTAATGGEPMTQLANLGSLLVGGTTSGSLLNPATAFAVSTRASGASATAESTPGRAP